MRNALQTAAKQTVCEGSTCRAISCVYAWACACVLGDPHERRHVGHAFANPGLCADPQYARMSDTQPHRAITSNGAIVEPQQCVHGRRRVDVQWGALAAGGIAGSAQGAAPVLRHQLQAFMHEVVQSAFLYGLTVSSSTGSDGQSGLRGLIGVPPGSWLGGMMEYVNTEVMERCAYQKARRGCGSKPS